ncbi:aminoglycoside adenylyltransferase family protein [Geomicrobium sediminis]|uniref:Spectinomycin 9-adenylyltransferase n=1 Tax=Geomicrobium sediminis TaxID=1347788 RepID=A0ABS2PA57_9BACL|nr:aminoglycoside adenylyltransferase family protein [Geomicrobium sediminis]MBM7632289.1 streptomycin 3'-adenylyltransferase [Geomicrobium sediminis]
MNGLSNVEIPKEAYDALMVVKEVIGDGVVAVTLYGSAVSGGLKKYSDVDVLVVVRGLLSDQTRRILTERLLQISGEIGNEEGKRYLELTVIQETQGTQLQYPPRSEFLYGEWLRQEFEAGLIPEPIYDPDLTIVLAQAREDGISLFGPELSTIHDPIPIEDIKKAILDSLSSLIENPEGDERNVLLTLARMWKTLEDGMISSKDGAAKWAISRLSIEHGVLLDLARQAYLGQVNDHWDDKHLEVNALIQHFVRVIEAYR